MVHFLLFEKTKVVKLHMRWRLCCGTCYLWVRKSHIYFNLWVVQSGNELFGVAASDVNAASISSYCETCQTWGRIVEVPSAPLSRLWKFGLQCTPAYESIKELHLENINCVIICGFVGISYTCVNKIILHVLHCEMLGWYRLVCQPEWLHMRPILLDCQCYSPGEIC